MGFWSIIVPAAGTNLVTNPSVETGTTGYTASGSGASIARVTTSLLQKWGLYGLQVTPGSGTDNGVYFGTVSLTSGTTYTASVYIKGTNGIPFKIWFANTSGTLQGTATTWTANGEWERKEVSWACTSTTTYRIYVTKNNSASTATYVIDGLQCEAASAASTYIDGDQDGCSWNAGKHNSTSTRSGQSRRGGTIVDLNSLGVYVKEFPGTGMPPNEHYVQSLAMQPGANFRGRKILPRTFSLSVDNVGSTWANMHSVRKDVIDYMKPDYVRDDQGFLLRYSGGNSSRLPVEIECVYQDGLDWSKIRGFTEEAKIKLTAYDPFFYEEGEQAFELTTTQTLTSPANVVGKFNGAWSALNGGLGASGVTIYAMAYDLERNRLYCGGGNGSSAYVLSYLDLNTLTWTALAAPNANVRALALDANGDLYIGGAFTTLGGVSYAYIAKYDESAGTYSALGTGMNGEVDGLAIDWNGDVYAVGSFTTSGGTTTNRVARWIISSSSWAALGSGTAGVGAQALCVAIGRDGYVYVGGTFTTAGGSSANYIAKWNGTAWSALGGGRGAQVNALAVADNGIIYAGANDVVSYQAIAQWDGLNWTTVGTSPNDQDVYGLYCVDSGLWAVGAFTTAGTLTLASSLAFWNGSTWVDSDAAIGNTLRCVLAADPLEKRGAYLESGYLFVGGSFTSGTVSYSNPTVTSSIVGTKAIYPKLIIKRAGGTTASLKWIKNETTNKVLQFDYNLQDGETLTIDTRPFQRSIVSSLYDGNVWRAMLRASDFADFYLLPTITMSAVWRNAFWSLDGAAA